MKSGLSCPPRWATRRRPDRPTYATAGRLDAVARLLGRPFMDWQRYVLETALEVDPASGRLAYQTVGLSVGRQEGKSFLVDALNLLRTSARRRQQAVYLCQDRVMARDRVLELAEGRAARYVAKVTRSNGSERVTFRNRSRLTVVAATAKAGRGRVVDQYVADEAALYGFDVIDALGPTQAARADPQAWVVSNAGDETSLMFWHYTELGREATALDPGSGVAWFEWGAGDDDDRQDPATWASAMPALGVTISPTFVATKLVELGRQPERFDREYLNRWPPGMGDTPGGVDLGAWAGATHPRTVIDGPRAFGVDVALDRSSATIAACGPGPGGRLVVEVVSQRPGTGWVTAELRRLRRRSHRAAVVAVDELVGASVVLALRAANLDVVEVGGGAFARACVSFDDLLGAAGLTHRGQAVLDDAVLAAARRRFGDGWAWSRTRSPGDIAPLVACVLATWAWRTRPPAPAPRVVTSSSPGP